MQTIMSLKGLLPSTNIDNLLVEEVLLNNYLKALGKRLHKLAVEA